MSASSASEKLIEIVTFLGGSRVTPEEIEWAIDLPAGEQLVEWLVAQVEGGAVTAVVDTSNDEPEVRDAYRAALKDISLEPEEILSCVVLYFQCMAFKVDINIGRWQTPNGRIVEPFENS